MDTRELWNRYQKQVCVSDEARLTLDYSRMDYSGLWYKTRESDMEAALKEMAALEAGAIANPDENRMVGHYWLRAPELAPTPELSSEITATVERIVAFAKAVHSGEIKPPTQPRFTQVLSNGIGGSALGPMFVADALGHPSSDKLTVRFLDNTDPDGIARALESRGARLAETLVLVTSKSGGTPETYNGMKIVEAAYQAAGLSFPAHAVAITMVGSKLDSTATDQRWLDRFPMFDWVGGRTSELSAVGLLPAALQGLDVRQMLAGAAACDRATRNTEIMQNPAAILALMWHHATGGKGKKDMVVLPYKDRLLLFSRYLQQLVMESLGKRLDLKGEVVEQGIAVYGNKGSTDQHAYVQQLRDGIHNFFVTFIRVLETGPDSVEVEPGITAGDYLNGFLLGTRDALSDNGRESLTITIPRVDAFTVGSLIALFERAVGLYASLIGINAYHQPGVEAGKKAAAAVLDIQRKVVAALSSKAATAPALAEAIGVPDNIETVYHVLEHLVANGHAQAEWNATPAKSRFTKIASNS